MFFRSCVSEAMHHGLHDAAVLGELGTAFAAQCDFATADQMLRASLALKDSPSLRLSFASGTSKREIERDDRCLSLPSLSLSLAH